MADFKADILEFVKKAELPDFETFVTDEKLSGWHATMTSEGEDRNRVVRKEMHHFRSHTHAVGEKEVGDFEARYHVINASTVGERLLPPLCVAPRSLRMGDADHVRLACVQPRRRP